MTNNYTSQFKTKTEIKEANNGDQRSMAYRN